MGHTGKFFTSCILFSAGILLWPTTGLAETTAKSFSLYMDGRVQRFTTSQPTVEAALREQNIDFKKRPMLPKPESDLVDGAKILLLNKGEKFQVKDEAVGEITKTYVNNPGLEYNTEKEVEAGHTGVDKVIYMVNDQGQQKEIGRIHLLAPKKAIIHKGIKDCVMTENGLKHFKRKFVANVSAYTIEDGNGDGVTSIGMVPYEGLVAVDPDFVRYKSKLFIPGYGSAMAGDTGGAIIDNCIDLFMYDRDRAWQWGRRHIEVYVLDD